MLRIFPFKTDGVITEIEQLEKNYSISLPEKYKEFLLKYNGGDTIDTRFKIEKIRSDIHSFYGFSLANHFSNFNYLVEKGFLEDFIENHYLPIAKDSFGNSILIGISASTYNKIGFYDHEKQTYIPFTIDFIEFLKKIKSPVVHIPSIGERMKEMEEIGSPVVVDDELKALWQEEIDEFAGREQVIVKLQPNFVLLALLIFAFLSSSAFAKDGQDGFQNQVP